jgi:acyl dehydratase
VRLTGNIAFAHTDASRSYLKKRLVYGGQTISLAYAQIMRAMPDTITLIGWQGCDHLSPVLEEDIIRSEFDMVRTAPAPSGGNLNELKVETFAKRLNQDNEYEETQVLDWRLITWSS